MGLQVSETDTVEVHLLVDLVRQELHLCLEFALFGQHALELEFGFRGAAQDEVLQFVNHGLEVDVVLERDRTGLAHLDVFLFESALQVGQVCILAF